MNAQQAKQVALASLLAHLGFAPKKAANDELWYTSPFRDEADASFKINLKRNVWYDFGLGQGGNVIDFVQQLYNLDFPGALAKFDEFSNLAPAPQVTAAPSKPKNDLELIKLIPLESHALKRYLQGRGISAEIAAPHVQEIHYRRNSKHYFALAFQNENEGYELRNPYFKGVYGRKAISVIGELANASLVQIFEGWIDYLSHLVYTKSASAEAPAIVLNSVAMGGRAIELIKSAEIKQVDLYFDRDEAGIALTTRFQAELAAMVIDRSTLYEGYKDFNDFLIASRSNQQSFRLHG